MPWTHFMDMHSGGGRKLPHQHIYIEAPADQARVIFYKRFGRNPERVTCTCCGSDYSISEHESLAQLTGFERGCRSIETPRDPVTGLYKNDDPVILAHRYLEDGEAPPEGYALSSRGRWREYVPLDRYLTRSDVLVIRASEISDAERVGEIPEEGYVWVN